MQNVLIAEMNVRFLEIYPYVPSYTYMFMLEAMTYKVDTLLFLLSIFLKSCASELATMLTFVIQQSLDKQTLPDDWRKALVTPAFKKGDRSNPDNYRPISLTSICWKIAEHIIASQTMTHLDQHRILVDCQHGFRKKRSFEAQLLITTHDLAVIMNNHSQADTAVLDFAKAFDNVPHRRLLVKLKHYITLTSR